MTAAKPLPPSFDDICEQESKRNAEKVLSRLRLHMPRDQADKIIEAERAGCEALFDALFRTINMQAKQATANLLLGVTRQVALAANGIANEVGWRVDVVAQNIVQAAAKQAAAQTMDRQLRGG